jgi:hypothetical protein
MFRSGSASGNSPASQLRSCVGLACGLIGLALAGCSSIGPASVPRDRIDYVGAMADSWKQQTLLNIVRLRYADTPTFMDVSSVIASYAFIGNLNAAANVNVGVPSNSTTLPDAVASIGGGGTYLDRPTVSYTPLSGDKFTKSLLRPIPPSAIFSLIAAGYPADFMLQVTVRALNGVYNRSNSGGSARPADPEFYRLLDALRRIQLSESFSLRVEHRGSEDAGLVVFAGRRSPEVQQDLDYVRSILNLKSEGGDVVLTYGALQRSGNELAVLSRSMLEILNELAARIEVPAEHVAEGRTFANVALGPDVPARDLPVVRIHSGAAPPENGFAAVRYQDTWYWIDDRDYDSKHAFTFLLLFFALAETGVQAQAPVLTLPVQ